MRRAHLLALALCLLLALTGTCRADASFCRPAAERTPSGGIAAVCDRPGERRDLCLHLRRENALAPRRAMWHNRAR